MADHDGPFGSRFGMERAIPQAYERMREREFVESGSRCPDGEIGRRSGLKIRRPQGRGGSSPPPGTILKLRYVFQSIYLNELLGNLCLSL